MNDKDRIFLKQGAGLIDQLASNIEAGIVVAVKDVESIQGLRNVALALKTRAEA